MSRELAHRTPRPDLGLLENHRQQVEDRRAEIEVLRRARNHSVEQFDAEMDHQGRLNEMERVAVRTEHGIDLAKGIWNRLVARSEGDEAAANFIAPIAFSGRDALNRSI